MTKTKSKIHVSKLSELDGIHALYCIDIAKILFFTMRNTTTPDTNHTEQELVDIYNYKDKNEKLGLILRALSYRPKENRHLLTYELETMLMACFLIDSEGKKVEMNLPIIQALDPFDIADACAELMYQIFSLDRFEKHQAPRLNKKKTS